MNDCENNGNSYVTDTEHKGLENDSFLEIDDLCNSTKDPKLRNGYGGSDIEQDETSFFEKSKCAQNANAKQERSNNTNEDLLDMNINLSPSYLKQFEDRHPDILKRKQLYQSMQPVSILENLLDDGNKYAKGTLQIDGPHEAVCIPTHTARCNIPIKVQGRGKIGQTFNGDEVVVELIHDEKIQDKRFGVVIGISDLEKHENVKRKIFACTFDEESCNLVRPVCKSVPKIHVLDNRNSKQSRKETGKRYNIALYNYDGSKGILTFSKMVNLNQEETKSSIFAVVYINWSPRHVYPRGAIIRILPMGCGVKEDLLVTNILHKVPSLYTKSAVKEVECLKRKIKDEPNEQDMNDRTNLCGIYTFTIDPPGSNDLDDALSVEDCQNYYRVGVHITDVSSYVTKDSSIDLEAKSRSQTFYSNIQNARCMLPETLSKNICSLLPNRLRKTLSIFFKIDKELLKRGEPSGLLMDQPVVCKTYIKSKKMLTYGEVQEIISSNSTNGVDHLNGQIKILHKISETLRKGRLKNASIALETYFEESPLEKDDIGTFQAHNLVEEFMILANSSIAEKLFKSRHGKCVPLRCHNPPPADKINAFLKANSSHIDIVCRLQDKEIGTKRPSFDSEIETHNKYVMVFKSIWGKMLASNTNATNYLRKDDLHPIQFVIYQQWLSIQEPAEYRCSGSLKKEEEKHYGLDVFPYTTFTSPIRRYIDLTVHRIVHATLFSEETRCPYSQDELVKICNYANIVSRNVKEYERRCKTLKLSTEIGETPRMFTCYVSNCTDKEVTFCTPSLKGPVNVQREIPFNLLDMIAKPVIVHDNNTNSDRVRVVWSKRLYDFHPVIVGRYLEDQELNPNLSISYIPLSTWVQLLRRLSVGNGYQKELKNSCIDLVRNTKAEPSRGLADVTTEHAKEFETDLKDEAGNRKCLVFQPSTRFSLTLHRGQRLDIQMTTVRQRGNSLFKPSLINLTKNVKFCLQHTDDPVLYLSLYSSKATRDSYRDVRTYLHIWLPILSMEAAKCVVRNEESFTLIEWPIQFKQDRTGTFALDENDCEMRKIEFSGLRYEDESRNEVTAPSYDWLCIKSGRCCSARNDEQCKASYFWVGHAEVTSVMQKGGKIIVRFLLHQTSRNDATIYNKDARFNIEVLKKSEVDRYTS